MEKITFLLFNRLSNLLEGCKVVLIVLYRICSREIVRIDLHVLEVFLALLVLRNSLGGVLKPCEPGSRKSSQGQGKRCRCPAPSE